MFVSFYLLVEIFRRFCQHLFCTCVNESYLGCLYLCMLVCVCMWMENVFLMFIWGVCVCLFLRVRVNRRCLYLEVICYLYICITGWSPYLHIFVCLNGCVWTKFPFNVSELDVFEIKFSVVITVVVVLANKHVLACMALHENDCIKVGTFKAKVFFFSHSLFTFYSHPCSFFFTILFYYFFTPV